MVATSECPDRAVLEQLALGRMPPDVVERLAGHCEKCERCVAVLEQLRTEDTLTEAMRAQATATATSLPETLLDRMSGFKRLRASRQEPETLEEASRAGQVSAPQTPAPAAKGEDTQELYDFLAPPQAADEIGRLGRYRVLRVLGVGGMGVVFLAEDPELKRRIALKAMKPALAASASARQRFLREAQAMAAVQHDHIVHINQIDQDRGIPFLVMPYLEGETLEDRLQREGRLPVVEVVRIGREVARGLAAAHSNGLIHRDIKPGNLWLEKEKGRVKILDFGLARVLDQEARLTQSGAIAGTPAYMAPEQAQGDAVDDRCDLFSLGCVLYRAATGAMPFQGRTSLEILRSLENDHPKPPAEQNPEIPVALSRLIVRLLAKNAGARPASADEVVQALEALQAVPLPAPVPAASSATSGATKRVGAKEQAKAHAARRWKLFVAIGLAAAALLFGSILFFARTPTATVLISVDVDLSDESLRFVLDGKGIDAAQLTRPVELKVGPHELIVLRNRDIVKQYRFTVRGGATPAIAFEDATPGQHLKKVDPRDEDDWEAKLKNLKPETHHPKVDVVPPPAVDRDRAAAEWFHGIGGAMTLRSEGRTFNVNRKGVLPEAPFKIVKFYCDSDRPLTDEAMRERLTGLPDVEGFDTGAPIDGTGFLCFKDHPKMIGLALAKAPITDEGLKAIGQIPQIESIFTDSRFITDDGLAHLSKHAEMRRLGLLCPFVTDVGFAHLKGLTNIHNLNLNRTQVGDASLAILAEWKQLDLLALQYTTITDAGMAHLARNGALRDLNLAYTGVGDAALEHLLHAPNLQILHLNGTKVTDEGVKRFQKARPSCKVER